MKKTLTIALATTMLFALTVGAPAQAHVRTASTKLTIGVSDSTPDQGDKVKFAGQLKSKWKACKARQSVLLKRGTKTVQTRKTTWAGRYSFTQRITRDSSWSVKYKGRRFGVHPHVHRCRGSKSRTIQIQV